LASKRLSRRPAWRCAGKAGERDLPRAYHAIAWEALQREGIVLDQAHVDTTSLSVQGAYEQASGDDSALRIDYGYSKDNRRDLKQIMFGLGSVQSLPLFADVMAGNTSDKTRNGSFAVQMAELLPQEQLKEMIVIADSALITEENLNLYADRPFISRPFPCLFGTAPHFGQYEGEESVSTKNQ
jgi:transposase